MGCMWAWLRDGGYVRVRTWLCVRDCEYVRVCSYMVRVISCTWWICTPARVRANDLEERRVRYTMVSAHVISLYRRVFDFTVSNVSNVSNLYFSRSYAWHVCVCVTVSCVRNQRMYTLCWMNCKTGYMGNEHKKCSFCMRSGIHPVYAIWNAYAVVCSLWDSYPCILRFCVICAIYVCYLPRFHERDFSI